MSVCTVTIYLKPVDQFCNCYSVQCECEAALLLAFYLGPNLNKKGAFAEDVKSS